MKKVTYIVLDESGALHQKDNDYFIIGGYITKQIYSVRSVHKKIEKNLKEKYPRLKKYTELKGCKIKSHQKAKFLNNLLKIDTTIPVAIIVDKRHTVKRTNHNENIKYNYFLQLLLKKILINYKDILPNERVQLILDNRNVSVGSLNSLEDYLNASLGLDFNKNFYVTYANSAITREVQFADLVANVLFGYYNHRSSKSAYHQVPLLKRAILLKFPYALFEEPDANKVELITVTNFQ